MEATPRTLETPRRDPNVTRLTQIGLLIASLGAVLIVFNPFGWSAAGLILAPVGTVLAARGGLGRTWFTVVAIGAVLAILSRIVAESAEVLGGWMAVLASVMILIGATIGFPSGGDQPE